MAEFVEKKGLTDVDETSWSTELRTSAENLIIAYDQMVSKLERREGKPDLDTEANDNKHGVMKSVCDKCSKAAKYHFCGKHLIELFEYERK